MQIAIFCLPSLPQAGLTQSIDNMASIRIVTPGEKVGDKADFEAGHGVYVRNDELVATLVGQLHQEARSGTKKAQLRVSSIKYKEGEAPLPKIGSRATVKVVKVTPRAAHVEIIVIDNRPLKEIFKGMIRQQDVRQTEVDKVEIYKCFAPGDVVLAQVISLGDRLAYFLSTAQNDLGVVYARSRAGVPMIPVNWHEMQCPATKAKEFRKVAKQ